MIKVTNHVLMNIKLIITIILKLSLNYLNGSMTQVIILCIVFTPPYMGVFLLIWVTGRRWKLKVNEDADMSRLAVSCLLPVSNEAVPCV